MANYSPCVLFVCAKSLQSYLTLCKESDKTEATGQGTVRYNEKNNLYYITKPLYLSYQ